ncbi:MAG: hypothetical protein CSA39_02490 [Flavobacteriales bacterium]|nr:MAG: hypothetical protein CSA39_02490 [Flavobacteriales bacterium]
MRKVNYALILLFYSLFSYAQIAHTNAQVDTKEYAVKTETEPKPIKYLIKYLDINTSQPDYAVTFNNGKVVFKQPNVKKLSSNPKIYAQSNLFIGDTGEQGIIENAIETTGISTRKITKTGAAFTADGKTVYFSAKKYRKRPRRRDKEQLFKATIDDKGNWINIEELPITGKDFASGEPSLNADETKLYFTSDRPESLGATDIFVVDINADGTFGTPKKLGNNINTSGYEVTPYITDDNILYFSSDGRSGGHGKLDVYKIDLNNPNAKAELLDAPVNGPNDDFAFIINENGDMGYFSSNRLQGGNNSDIYSVVIENNTPKNCTQLIAGIVKDKDTEEVIANADITLLDQDNNKVSNIKTDENGAYELTLNCNQTYTLLATGDHYTTEEHIVNTANYIDAPKLEANKFLTRQSEENTVAKTDDETEENNQSTDNTTEDFDDEAIAEAVYFGFDKYNITNEAANELDRIAQILKQNQNVHLEVGGYTDARGKSAYNKVLSEKRAKSAVDYLISQGVDADRLTYKGYGETKMVNKCVDGVSCSEAAHAKNRRTEFNFINPQASIGKDAPSKKKTIIISQTNQNQPKSTKPEKESSPEDSFSQKKETTETPQSDELNIDKDKKTITENTVKIDKDYTQAKKEGETIEEPKMAVADVTAPKVDTPVHNFRAIGKKTTEKTEEPLTEAEVTEFDKPLTSENNSEKAKTITEKSDKKISEQVAVNNQKTEVVAKEKSKSDEILKNTDTEKQWVQNTSTTTRSDKTITHNRTEIKDELLANSEQAREKTDEILKNTNKENTVKTDTPKEEEITKNTVSVEHALDNLITGRKPDKPTAEELEKKAKEDMEAAKAKSKKKPRKVANPIPVNSVVVTPMQNKRGKFIENDRAKKIHALRLTFTVIPNPKAEKGYKDAYVVIKSPDGKIISQKGQFTLSTGDEEFYTDATNIYYLHQKMKVVMFIEKIIHKFSKGTYTAAVYIEGLKVGEAKFLVQG